MGWQHFYHAAKGAWQMAFVENYLSKIGVQTGNVMKTALFELLVSRYRAAYEADLADKLAASVVNRLFCETANDAELRSFADESTALVESKVKELSSEDALCKALTCAVYNFCYGRYVDSGRKVGMLSHPFLGYVRALQEVASGNERTNFLEALESKVGEESVRPLVNPWLLGLYRPLPSTPDSKLMLDEVAAFRNSKRVLGVPRVIPGRT
jgi:hypothetical protein